MQTQLQEKPIENNSMMQSEAYQTQTGRKLVDRSALDAEVQQLFKELVDVEPKSPEAGELQQKIRTIGHRDLKKLSDSNNSFLSKSLKNSDIDNNIDEFKKVLDFLNPYAKKERPGFMKMLSMFNPKEVSIKERYKETEQLLESVLQSLYSSRYDMLRHNVAIEVEKEEMEPLFDIIESKLYVVRQLTKLAEEYTAAQNLQYKKYLQDEFVFYLKQRQIDMNESFAVNIQTYLTLEVTRRNNEGVVKWIERTGSVSILALKTALLSKSQEEFNEKARLLVQLGEEIAKIGLSNLSADTLKETDENIDGMMGQMGALSQKIKEQRVLAEKFDEKKKLKI